MKTADGFAGSTLTVNDINTFYVGRNYVNRLGAFLVAVNTEYCACKVLSGSAVILEQSDTVNVGNNLVGGIGAGFVIALPGSVSFIKTVSVGSSTDSSACFNNCGIGDFYLCGSVKFVCRIFGKG